MVNQGAISGADTMLLDDPALGRVVAADRRARLADVPAQGLERDLEARQPVALVEHGRELPDRRLQGEDLRPRSLVADRCGEGLQQAGAKLAIAEITPSAPDQSEIAARCSRPCMTLKSSARSARKARRRSSRPPSP